MSAIQFGCPFCGALAEVDADMAGRETACPACESVLVVPLPAAATADRATAPASSSPPSGAERRAPRPAKAKLWQTTPRSGTEDTAPPQPAASDQRATSSEPVDLEEIFRDLSGGETAGPVTTAAAGGRYARSATEVARAENARRRYWVNAAMLVASMMILVAALAGLMYLTSK